MAEKVKNNKEKITYSYIPLLPPLSAREKKELEMRIYVTICQSSVSK